MKLSREATDISSIVVESGYVRVEKDVRGSSFTSLLAKECCSFVSLIIL